MEMLEIKVIDGEITLSDEAEMALKYYGAMKQALADAEIKEKQIRASILNAMEENGIKKFENDFVVIGYKAGGTRKNVDTKKLKEDGLYEKYTKDLPVSPSVTITYKDE